MNVAWKSHKGKRKKRNEDSVLVDRESGLYLLADGMSWPRGGDIASDIAVQHAHAFLKDRLESAVHDEEILSLMKKAIVHAHEAVQKASHDPARHGMGTTLMVLFIREDTAYVTHVGDSRAYHLSEHMELITTDHTLENSVQNDGMIRELFFLQKARVLTQALGPSKILACDGHRITFRPGEYLLLCSDGLTDMLSDETIEQLIDCNGPVIDSSAEALVEAANRMGGHDNISVILITP